MKKRIEENSALIKKKILINSEIRPQNYKPKNHNYEIEKNGNYEIKSHNHKIKKYLKAVV